MKTKTMMDRMNAEPAEKVLSELEAKYQQKAFDAKTGETLACTDRHKPCNHFYVGMDFHGNRRCSCGGMFLKESLVVAINPHP